MNPVEIIRKKRNGGVLAKNELQEFITAYVNGTIPDYQMSAFLMAVYFSGMGPEETSMFTEVMLHSGEIIDLSGIPGRKVDKHSTGGVGDKVSLILAPMVAACGVPVPMISGRGLGHTGGTLDKLEAIPGFRTDLSVDEYKRVIEELGVVLIGQTNDIAPADRRMYALRDVTATVESIPLIAGSIMSKKMAEGIDALVLDVKTGSGAFMQKEEDARALADTLVAIGTSFGKETVAFITEMDQPLGMMIGNWLEVVESVECLRGKNIVDLMEVTYVLGGAMVHLGGCASSIQEGIQMCHSAIWSGKAYDKFLQIVERQGGDVSYITRLEKFPRSLFTKDLQSSRSGYLSGFDTLKVGLVATELGAGRQQVGDRVDPKAGIVLHRKIGDRVEKGDILATLHTDRENVIEQANRALGESLRISEDPLPRRSCIRTFIDRTGARPWVPLEVS